jgi:uncharacterized protein (TIGR03067 family)
MRLTCACLLAAAAACAAAGAGPARKDRDALQGAWSVVSLRYNGKDLTDRYPLALVFKGDRVTVEGDGKVRKEYATLTCKLDPSTSPKCVDITVAGGSQKGAALEGIYELKGGTLRLCVRVLGKDRPAEFRAPAGSSTALLVLKRRP